MMFNSRGANSAEEVKEERKEDFQTEEERRCIEELIRQKRALDAENQRFEADILAHRSAIDQMSSAQDMPTDDEKHRIIRKFEREIFVQLNEEDRRDVLESMQEALDTGNY